MELEEFVTDPRAMKDGMWVTVDPAKYGELEILACGFTDEMIDARAEMEAAAAERLNIDVTRGQRLPNAEQRRINATLLERYLVRDVRGLTNKGNPISVEEFHRLMYLPGYENLSAAAWQASRRISTITASQMEQAMGNSLKPLTSSSNGQAYGSNLKE
jgi:hypothetical protein